MQRLQHVESGRVVIRVIEWNVDEDCGMGETEVLYKGDEFRMICFVDGDVAG